MAKLLCPICGRIFNVTPSRLRERNIKYCSVACRYQFNDLRFENELVFIKLNDGVEAIVDLIDYDKIVGVSNKWTSAWRDEIKGYYVRSEGKSGKIYLHRLIMGNPDGHYLVDHINHNPLDNRRSNLRLVTNSQNMQNRKGAAKGSCTGIRGAYWNPKSKKYYAKIKAEKNIYLGYFDSMEKARLAAEEARRRHMTHSSECLEGSSYAVSN